MWKTDEYRRAEFQAREQTVFVLVFVFVFAGDHPRTEICPLELAPIQLRVKFKLAQSSH